MLPDWLPRWVDQISPDYKRLRKQTTRKYGLLTLVSSLVIVAFIGLFNYLHHRYYYGVRRRLRLRLVVLVNRPTPLALFWLLYSLALVVPECHHDLMFITKRLGRMAVSLMPFLFFLTLRPSPLPKTLYLNLVPVHKWVSRIVVLQSLVHTVLYTWSFIHTGTVWKIWHPKQIYGWIAMVAFIVIGATSLYPVRRRSFAVFYINHYVLSWVLVGFLYFHLRPPAKLAILLSVAILLFQAVLRLGRTLVVRLKVTNLSSNLKVVEFDRKLVRITSFWGYKPSLMPCSHLRIQKKYKNPFKNAFYRLFAPLAHPYSIASLPSDKSVVLVMRNTRFDLNEDDEYYITGAYDLECNMVLIHEKPSYQKLPAYKKWFFQSPSKKTILTTSNIITLSSQYTVSASRVLMIIGGSGISVALPLLRLFNIQGIPSKIIWVIKDVQDLRLFRHFKTIDINSIEVFLTSKTYRFESLRNNTLSLDDVLGDSEQGSYDTGATDFTSFGLSNSTVPDQDSQDALLAKRKRRSKSLSSAGSSSQMPERVSMGRSFKDILMDNLHLDTFSYDTDDDDIDGSNADNVSINLSSNTQNYMEEHALRRRKQLSRGYGSINFAPRSMTRLDSRLWKTNEEFKIPITLKPSDPRYAGMLKQLRLYKGRPTLGQDEFNWCLNHMCGLEEASTENLLERSNLLTHSGCKHVQSMDLDAVLEKVWVVGVGPLGLIEKTRLWAHENRLNFQEENFAI